MAFLFQFVTYGVKIFTTQPFSTSKLKTKLRGLSPQANYTDRAAAAGRRG